MVPVALMYCRTPSGSFGAHGSSLPGNADRGRCVLVLFASLVALLPGGCSSAMPSEPALCAAGCTHDDAEVSPLAVGEDVDRDGLRDDEEAAIALRFAPIVTLHAADWTRPASVAWVGLRGGAFGSKPWDGAHGQAKSGSADPADWVTYVHVCPAGYGGVIVQYWFFYPYNDGPLWFNHEADWEHVTVALDVARAPLGMWAARHGDNAPGVWRAWDRLRKVQDTHPEVLSAKGSHASYFDLQDVRWVDEAGRCESLERGCVHTLWRTWEAGGLRNLGELRAPLDLETMGHAGRWGASGLLPGTSAPRGPAFQRGWCAAASPSCSHKLLSRELATAIGAASIDRR